MTGEAYTFQNVNPPSHTIPNYSPQGMQNPTEPLNSPPAGPPLNARKHRRSDSLLSLSSRAAKRLSTTFSFSSSKEAELEQSSYRFPADRDGATPDNQIDFAGGRPGSYRLKTSPGGTRRISRESVERVIPEGAVSLRRRVSRRLGDLSFLRRRREEGREREKDGARDGGAEERNKIRRSYGRMSG
jgi:hypothetical protein